MSHFKATIHQIRFRLGLRPRPRWGSLQRSPRPPSWIQGSLLLAGGGEGKERGKGDECEVEMDGKDAGGTGRPTAKAGPGKKQTALRSHTAARVQSDKNSITQTV